MTKRLSHTIRFDEDKKELIRKIGDSQHRKFQEQVEYMLDEQLKNEQVLFFLNRARCVLEASSETERLVLMAKIANLLEMEL